MLCNLCPRRCNALRTDTVGEGYCRMPAAPVAARAPHLRRPWVRDHLLLRLLPGVCVLSE